MIDESLIDVIIHPSGVITEFKPPYTLEQLQEQVGGYIQSVPLYDDIIMIVNEEGKLQNLLPNLRASYNGTDWIYPPTCSWSCSRVYGGLNSVITPLG